MNLPTSLNNRLFAHLAVLMCLSLGLSNAQAQKAAIIIDAKECTISLKHSAVLASERVGILAKFELELGQKVKAGETVAKLRDDIARLAYEKAVKQSTNDVQIKYASSAAEVAQQELEIALSANAKLLGTVPEVEVKKLRLAARKGELQIESAQFEQDVAVLTTGEALAQVKSYVVTAPFDGTVRRVLRKAGEAVRQGDPILEIYSERVMRVTGYITIEQSYTVQVGDAVAVQLVLNKVDLDIEKVFHYGKIMLVDPEGSPLLDRVQVVAEVKNTKQNQRYILRAGLDALMKIQPAPTPTAKASAKAIR